MKSYLKFMKKTLSIKNFFRNLSNKFVAKNLTGSKKLISRLNGLYTIFLGFICTIFALIASWSIADAIAFDRTCNEFSFGFCVDETKTGSSTVFNILMVVLTPVCLLIGLFVLANIFYFLGLWTNRLTEAEIAKQKRAAVEQEKERKYLAEMRSKMTDAEWAIFMEQRRSNELMEAQLRQAKNNNQTTTTTWFMSN